MLLKSVYDTFDSSLLGLGDIRVKAVSIDAIAVVFDLEGFTQFGKQIEPHLAVPMFLSEFLTWLIVQIRKEMTHKIFSEGVYLYGQLPFLVKFLGDGLLVLWDVSAQSDLERRNIVMSVGQISQRYKDSFLPIIAKKVADPPPKLRCGIARRTVYSVGNGNDYVGSCINMASRLQKLAGFTFVLNRRGFDLEDKEMGDFFTTLVVKKFPVRGIGDHELIAFEKDEYGALAPEEQSVFKEP